MLHQAATLNSSMSIGDAVKRLEYFPDEAFVVVRRRDGMERYWYEYRVGDIRDFANRADSNWPDKQDTPLIDVLNLHEYTSSKTVQLSEGSAEKVQLQHGILLDGETVLGVLESMATAGATRGDITTPSDVSTRSIPGSTRSRRPVVERGISLDSATGNGSEDDTNVFKAYPRLTAPNGVQFNTTFKLTVGLTKEQLTPTTEAIVVADAPSDEFDLLVQVIAPGFKAPAGTQRLLHVKRDNPTANAVRFDLVATDDEPTEPRLHALEVQFSFNGNACGRAWRDITVVPANMSVTDVSDAKTGSSPLTTPGGSHAPDLTISITEADEDGRFVWLFTSPHSVNLFKDKQIETRLDNHNARSFAAKVLKGIPGKDGTDQVGMHMTGTAREIAQAMPTEFWRVLGEVWSLVHAQGVPRLLFLSGEPYVPWELASVEKDYIDPDLLDSKYPKILNAQTRVGRWLPPRPRTPRGGVRPTQPPPARVGVRQMAVVTGDYLAIHGIRPLPEAEEEGKLLTGRYRAVHLTATWDDIKNLLQNRIERNGQQVDIELMHFACHGQVDTANPTHNGIVMNDGNMRLDPTTARGNTIGAATQPFAFMNACEVGMAGETLGSYGGLAAAFLNEGFRGFIAPLWAVNDELAHDFALKFYEKTLDEHEPVGEALRALRLDYDPHASMPSSTHLAYIFYGHPDLVLERQ